MSDLESSVNSVLLEKVKEDNVKFVNLWFTDFFGSVKSTSITVDQLPESLEKGTWFDGSSIEGYARIHESDMILRPDPETYSLIPWRPKENAVARLICDINKPDGTPFPGDPRNILKKVIEEAKDMGFTYNTGPECEFFLFKGENGANLKPVTHDVGGYFDLTRDLATDVRRNIVFALEKMGMVVEMSHHEVAPGQHEIDVKYSDALKSADNTITLKTTTKAIANSMDLYATFMPKPLFGENGSGMHVNQSLFDLDGNNVFFDPNDEYKISDIAKQFIAGQLNHVKGLSAVVAPSVNSYKRLVPGYEAPVYISWANQNRSALIRVPQYSPGREKAIRAELRCPDPSCNPYLAFAVMLKAGLDGIKNGNVPPEPVEEDVYEFDDKKLLERNISTLPGSLGEAIEELSKDPVILDALGPHTAPLYIKAKKAEWDDYRIQVSPWELKQYYETT